MSRATVIIGDSCTREIDDWLVERYNLGSSISPEGLLKTILSGSPSDTEDSKDGCADHRNQLESTPNPSNCISMIIFNEILERCTRYRSPDGPREFINLLKSRFDFLDIFTTALDDFMDDSVIWPQDGFDPVGSTYEGGGGYSVFDPELVFDDDGRDVLNHLNGSVFFTRGGNGSSNCIYKLETPSKSLDRSKPPILLSRDHEEALQSEPFRTYRSNLIRSLAVNRRLVLIGYVFGPDKVLDSMISDFIRGNGNKMLVVSTERPQIIVPGKTVWLESSILDASRHPDIESLLQEFMNGPQKVRE